MRLWIRSRRFLRQGGCILVWCVGDHVRLSIIYEVEYYSWSMKLRIKQNDDARVGGIFYNCNVGIRTPLVPTLLRHRTYSRPWKLLPRKQPVAQARGMQMVPPLPAAYPKQVKPTLRGSRQSSRPSVVSTLWPRNVHDWCILPCFSCEYPAEVAILGRFISCIPVPAGIGRSSSAYADVSVKGGGVILNPPGSNGR